MTHLCSFGLSFFVKADLSVVYHFLRHIYKELVSSDTFSFAYFPGWLLLSKTSTNINAPKRWGRNFFHHIFLFLIASSSFFFFFFHLNVWSSAEGFVREAEEDQRFGLGCRAPRHPPHDRRDGTYYGQRLHKSKFSLASKGLLSIRIFLPFFI